MHPPVLEARNVAKRFPPNVVALADASLRVERGEVHCLLGANGAGKSTLLKILAGAHQADGGEIQFEGKPCRFRTPTEAARTGLAMTYQELDLVPALSVEENLFLGHVPRRFGLVDRRKRRELAEVALGRVGANIDPRARVGELSIAQQQLTAIARALTLKSKLVIMDEPSAALNEQELERVFAVMRELTREGTSILYVSHRLKEIAAIGDRATVMRDGRTIGVYEVKDTSEQQLISAMIGDHLSLRERAARPRRAIGDVALQVHSLEGPAGLKIEGLQVRGGEIVGLAGLNGSGRTTLLQVLFGGLRGSGRMELFGQSYRAGSPREAIRRGIGLVPENRKTEGLNLGASLARNAAGPSLPTFRYVTERRLAEFTRPVLDDLGTRYSALSQPVGQLSGGNQQKIVMAKWLLAGSRLLLLDEPSRGLDVGAKDDLYELVRRRAEAGAAVLVASSELDELYAYCDVIWVFHEGRNTECFRPDEDARETILHATITGRRPTSS